MFLKIVQLTTDNREPFREYHKSDPWFGTAPEALLQGLARLNRQVEVHVVSCTQRPMHSPEKLAENIWFHSLHVPKIGWLRTGYQGCIRAVRKRLKVIQPDIVHGQGTERDCAITAVLSGFPNVITIHGNMRLVAEVNRTKPFSFNWLAARLEQFTIPRSRGVVCLTNHSRKAVSNLARKTWLIPNAVDESFFDIEPARAEKHTVLCVGTVCLHKNQNRLIQALDSIVRPPGFLLRFLGRAPEGDPYCAEFFRLIATRPWCTYAGFAGRAELETYLAGASALILPSLEENCPMVILEAMAAGVPVAAAMVGGVLDLIEPGISGYLFDPTNSKSIGQSVVSLLYDGETAKRMREVARQRALQSFHPDVIAQAHLAIYREVIDGAETGSQRF